MQSNGTWPGGGVVDPAYDEGTPHHAVWLGLLGSFRLARWGRAVMVRSGGKTEALLAHLGLASLQGVPRSALLRELWPDTELSLAGNALNNLVYGLRGLLADALGGAPPVVHTAGYYRLNHEAGVAVDVAEFKALAAKSDWLARAGDSTQAAEIAERAVRLYRGDLSASGGSGAHAISERDQLRAACLGLLMRLAERAFDRGEYGACLGYANQLLEYDPCREDAHRLLMRCYVRRGERAQALRHYGTVQAILRAEFDAETEPATRTLYELVRLDPSAV